MPKVKRAEIKPTVQKNSPKEEDPVAAAPDVDPEDVEEESTAADVLDEKEKKKRKVYPDMVRECLGNIAYQMGCNGMKKDEIAGIFAGAGYEVGQPTLAKWMRKPLGHKEFTEDFQRKFSDWFTDRGIRVTFESDACRFLTSIGYPCKKDEVKKIAKKMGFKIYDDNHGPMSFVPSNGSFARKRLQYRESL